MNSLDEQLLLNGEMLAQRVEAGDKLSAAREVEHFAYFRRYSDALKATSQLSDAGFEIDLDRRVMRTAIRASITSNVEASTSDALVTTVFTVVDRNNGNYDGWGAEVVE
jgi:hypothetical protein